MRRRIAWIGGVLALAAVVVVGLLQAGSDGTVERGPDRARSAVDQRRALQGAPAELAALHRQASERLDSGYRERLRELTGRPIVVNFWASWCGPCRFEMPFFQEQAVTFGKRVAFLGVNPLDSDRDAREFLEGNPVPFPSYVDPDNRIFSSYRLKGMPATIFFDRDGNRTIHQGPFTSPEDLADAIRRYALA